jgi:outer membrane protein assembly factor BamE (lipoprotein component of BamABCDE complex)
MFVACVILAVVSLYPGSIRSKLDLVTPGMTEAQVLEILGRPFNEHHFPDGRSYWAYPDGFHDPWLIYFDENREVVEVR